MAARMAKTSEGGTSFAEYHITPRDPQEARPRMRCAARFDDDDAQRFDRDTSFHAARDRGWRRFMAGPVPAKSSPRRRDLRQEDFQAACIIFEQPLLWKPDRPHS